MVTVHTSTTVIEAGDGELRGPLPGQHLEQLCRDIAKELARELAKVVIADIRYLWQELITHELHRQSGCVWGSGLQQGQSRAETIAEEACLPAMPLPLASVAACEDIRKDSKPKHTDGLVQPCPSRCLCSVSPNQLARKNSAVDTTWSRLHSTPAKAKTARQPRLIADSEHEVDPWVSQRLISSSKSPRGPQQIICDSGQLPPAIDLQTAPLADISSLDTILWPPRQDPADTDMVVWPQRLEQAANETSIAISPPRQTLATSGGESDLSFAECPVRTGNQSSLTKNPPLYASAEGSPSRKSRGSSEASAGSPEGPPRFLKRGMSAMKNEVDSSTGHVANKDHRLFGELGMDKNKLDQDEYKVENYYWETGCFAKVARSELFANITFAVIGANAIYIGYDADNNPHDNISDADVGYRICENAFCMFFTVEWFIRFGAFRNKFHCLLDMWFKFDTALVLLMVFESWLMPLAFAGGGIGIPTGVLKLLRMLRLARMARLMRAFPELVAMIKGVKQASRAVGSALLLLVLLIYCFAIVMFTLLKDETQKDVHYRFGRLGTVMVTLLTDGAYMDGITITTRTLLDAKQWLAAGVFMIFVLLSALTVMNMLIGVLCEVVSAVAAAEKEDSQIRLVKDKLLGMLRDLDEDGSGMISQREIQAVLNDAGALSVLESLQVDVQCLLDELHMFYQDGEELSIHQIMDLILMLRGDRSPTMKDMLHGHDFSRWKMTQAMNNLERQITTFTEDQGAKSEYIVNILSDPQTAR